MASIVLVQQVSAGIGSASLIAIPLFIFAGCSNLGDAQARRLKIRVKGEDGKKYFAHTLNNTVVAPPRMLIAFLENNLNADGSVNIPKALQPYMGGTEKLIPKH